MRIIVVLLHVSVALMLVAASPSAPTAIKPSQPDASTASPPSGTEPEPPDLIFHDRFEEKPPLPAFALEAVAPFDGEVSVDVQRDIVLTFNQAVDPTTLFGQTNFGPCDGTVQLSDDEFASCLPFAEASAVISAGDSIATLVPAPALSFGSSYKIRVLTDVQSAAGEPLPELYESGSDWSTALDARCDLVEIECAINESGLDDEADFCNLQWPPSITTTAGSSTPVFGRIFEDGQTGSGSVNPQIQAQMGFGPIDRNPQHEAGWHWTDATFNLASGNDDEYQADLIAPDPGEYLFGYRFSFDGFRWTYCDAAGAGSNPSLRFQVNQLGQLLVTAAE